VTYGYENEVMLLVPVTVSKDLPAGGEAAIRAELAWQSCKDTCVDGEAKVALTLPVRAQAERANVALFEAWRGRLPVAREQGGDAIAKVEQETGADGAPLPAVTVEWKTPPAAAVDWYPVATRAVAVENVVVVQDGARTRIRFKPTVYKPEDVPGGRVEGVLVFEDGSGRRRGVEVAVGVGR
jgi:DsbC/DsbD-like thiol-disulfide interchange protein